MPDLSFSRSWFKGIQKQGFDGKVVSIAHLKELQDDIAAHRQKGLLDKDLDAGYLASFDFECQKKLSGARSLIILTAPQPQVKVTFARQDQIEAVIIPPTYSHASDAQVAALLNSRLKPAGYRLKKVRLPEKLLAVRSGLAQYGKNNITYVKGMGSFHRPAVFVSDMPCETGSWSEPGVMEQCETCSACRKACPTDAIGSDRFLLHAERCLTFHNEGTHDFPGWLASSWHNSLVGCMICQKVCPANKEVLDWIKAGEAFNPEETDLILNGVSEKRLPRRTLQKLRRLGMMEYYGVLGRNLRALIEHKI